MTYKVLAVCSFTPFPVHGGDHVRVFGLLKALSARVNLTVWCVESARGDVDAMRATLPGVTVALYPRDRRDPATTGGDLRRYGVSTVRGIPSWILKRESAELTRSLAQRAAEWDGVIALGEASAQYFDGVARSWHWDKFNVQTVSVADEFSWGVGIASSIRDYVTLNATRRYERLWAERAASVSVTNSEESARYQEVFGVRPIIVHSTVPVPEKIERTPVPGRLLWLGSYGYKSNRDGLEKFLEHSWASLSRDFVLRVVGAGMGEADRRALSTRHNVEAVGFVPDIAQELALAEVGVVPLWSGGGTKMKTLTMMAAGLPVVSSPAGVEGIHPDRQREFYVASAPSDFAQTIKSAVSDPELSEVGSRGRARILERFCEAGIQDQYDGLIRAVTEAATS